MLKACKSRRYHSEFVGSNEDLLSYVERICIDHYYCVYILFDHSNQGMIDDNSKRYQAS